MQTAEKSLSLPQIDALLEMFRGRGGAHLSAQDVSSYDLETPARVPRTALEAVVLRYEQAAKVMQADLSTLLNNEVRIALESFEQIRFGALRDGLPEPSVCFVIDLAPLREPAFLSLDYSLVFAAIDRLLGGSGSGDGEPRDLTSTELAVLEDFVRPILNAHAFAWQPYTSLKPKVSRAVFVPRYVRDLRTEDVMLLGRFRFGGETPGGPALQFAVPLSGLEPHLQHEPRPVVPAVNRAAIERDLAQNLSAVSVKTGVRIGGAQVRLRDVLGLQPGDVIVLDRQINEPCELTIEGAAKFAGYLGQHGGAFTWKMARRLDQKGTGGRSGDARGGRNA
jgi:flagellar motor switch protein FliM